MINEAKKESLGEIYLGQAILASLPTNLGAGRHLLYAGWVGGEGGGGSGGGWFSGCAQYGGWLLCLSLLH